MPLQCGRRDRDVYSEQPAGSVNDVYRLCGHGHQRYQWCSPRGKLHVAVYYRDRNKPVQCGSGRHRRRKLLAREIFLLSGTSPAPATRPSRDSPPTSASTRAGRSTSRSTRPRPLTASTSTGWATTAATERGRSPRSLARSPKCSTNCVTDGATGLDRLRQLGGVRLLGRAGDAVSGIYFAELVRTDTAGRATSSSSSATTTASRTSCSRPPTRPGRPTTSTAATASTSADRLPAAPTRSATTGRSRRAATSAGGLGLQRRVPDGPLARGQRLRRQLLHRVSTPTAAAREYHCRQHTELFLSVGHDEYWSGAQRANVEAAREPA